MTLSLCAVLQCDCYCCKSPKRSARISERSIVWRFASGTQGGRLVDTNVYNEPFSFKDVYLFQYKHCVITYFIVNVHVVELGIFSTRYFLMFRLEPLPATLHCGGGHIIGRPCEHIYLPTAHQLLT